MMIFEIKKYKIIQFSVIDKVTRPTLREIDATGTIVPRHEDEDLRDTIYQKPLMPGYEGYIPRTQSKYGRRYAVVTSEGLSEFERECLRTRTQMKKLRHRTAQPISTISEYSLGDRMKVRFLAFNHAWQNRDFYSRWFWMLFKRN